MIPGHTLKSLTTLRSQLLKQFTGAGPDKRPAMMARVDDLNKSLPLLVEPNLKFLNFQNIYLLLLMRAYRGRIDQPQCRQQST